MALGEGFALNPNAAQQAAMRSHCGAARAAYNWAVGWVSASWWQRKAEETYGVPEAGQTQWRPWSLPSLRKAFNAAKHTDPRFAHWWAENSKEAYSTGLVNAFVPVVNRQARRAFRFDLNRGAPIFRPWRLPCLDLE
ncbi:helix-turn-helix domain-containing protein [Streptomyces sp. NPDC059349]|uniref:helix-turn-helix domain-containing protein n=1 Tax=Streptomyces sp. NPDC059349 TaxID=3346808 RepID=UPI0036A86B8C